MIPDSDDEFIVDSDEDEAAIAEEAEDAIEGARKRARSKVTNPCPREDFDKNLDKFVKEYVVLVDKSEGPFTWEDIKPPKGEGFSDKQRQIIRRKARKENPKIFPERDAKGFVEFPPSRIKAEFTLPEELLKKGDYEQFEWLDKQMKAKDKSYDSDNRGFSGSDKRYTWHHHKDTGKMQLVEMAIHDVTNHKGGREVWGGGEKGRKTPKGAKRNKSDL